CLPTRRIRSSLHICGYTEIDGFISCEIVSGGRQDNGFQTAHQALDSLRRFCSWQRGICDAYGTAFIDAKRRSGNRCHAVVAHEAFDHAHRLELSVHSQHKIKCSFAWRNDATGPDDFQLIQKELTHLGDPFQMSLTIWPSNRQGADGRELRDDRSANQ